MKLASKSFAPVAAGVLAAILVAGLAADASAQQSFTGSYTQNFDSLASTPNGAVISLSGGTLPITGWYYNSATYSHYVVDDGSSATSQDLFSYGSVSASDRALGVANNGNTALVAFGLRLVNNTGSTVNSLSVAFTGEQWHMSSHPVNTDPLTFDYKVANNGAGSLLDTVGYTADPTLTFIALQSGSGALDGNQGTNQTAKSDTLSGLGWGDGQELWLRWTSNPTGATPGLAMDNLSISTVPEPSTLTLVAGASLLALSRRRRANAAARAAGGRKVFSDC